MHDSKEPKHLDFQGLETLPVEQVLQVLGATSEGLPATDAAARLNLFGYNEIPEPKPHPFRIFLGFFWGPIPWMIEAAALLAAIIKHWEDFWIILAMLFLNAVVAFAQHRKADRAIALLKENLALTARVKREGQWLTVPARELVPGDVVRLRLGDIVPADARLLTGAYLLLDESALTGESLPASKKSGDLTYAGAIVRQGEMEALVTATGAQSFLGRAAHLAGGAVTQSHFQKALVKIGNYLIIFGLALVAVLFLAALFRHHNLLDTLQYALVLTVAAIPATLPAVLSVTLAIGAGLLARQGAITRNLAALDELAGMDVLCSDKTGTITQNVLTVGEIRAFPGHAPADALLLGALAAQRDDGDPLDAAIIRASSARDDVAQSLADHQVLDFTPFDPVTKRTEARVQDRQGLTFQVAKGAPQAIAALLPEPSEAARLLDPLVEEFAARGFRPLAVGRREEGKNWRLVGLLGLYDPPREDSAATLSAAQALGVKVKMVTGDHLAIAREVSRNVGLGSDIQPVSAFLDRPDRQARRVVEQADGFAQVFPEHKLHIVELLQDQGHIVGMTGDGVNDAPALKKADVGIAVAGATDAARAAAHIVLTRPGLSVIVDAIRESRRIFQRMQSYAIYRIGGIIRVLLFIVLSALIFQVYPVTAVMIVLQTLLNDIPILSIAFDRAVPDPHPERWQMREIFCIAFYLGVMGVIFSFSLLWLGLKVLELPAEALQTLIFLKLTVAGYLDIFMGRTRGLFWRLPPGALLLWSGVASRLAATALALLGWFMAPIGWHLALLVWGWAILELFLTDPLKVLVYRVLDHTGVRFRR